MKKSTNQATETQLLQLLKKVLPKATHDPELAGKIYEAVEYELKSTSRSTAFEKFCGRVALPDLEPASVQDAKRQFSESFPEADVTLRPNRREKSLDVELALPDGLQFTGEIKVNANPEPEGEEQEIKLKFIPFPVCLPGDVELVWFIAKREDLSPDEASVALIKCEDDFWGSKTGQKLLRDRVERSFPEFISRAPAGMLSEAGLKRHYKTPEAIKVLRPLKK
jgi:hypothetical protein